jgi:hypothetical protein
LKQLLTPLLVDDVVSRPEYEVLLSNLSAPGWRDEAVEDALKYRLAESYERYLEILEEMEEAMAKLSKAFKVDDPQFQSRLENSQVGQLRHRKASSWLRF